MPLKLNRIAEQIIRENLARDKERLAKFQNAEPDSPMRNDPVRYYRRMAECALEVGLESYQQEESVAEIREALARASESYLALMRIKRVSALEFEKALALAVLFGAHSEFNDMDASAHIFRPTVTDLIGAGAGIFAVLVDCLDLLCRFVVSGCFDQGEWTRVETLCLKPHASRYDAKVNLSKLRALEHFSYCCRALKGSLNQAFASSAVRRGSSCAMA